MVTAAQESRMQQQTKGVVTTAYSNSQKAAGYTVKVSMSCNTETTLLARLTNTQTQNMVHPVTEGTETTALQAEHVKLNGRAMIPRLACSSTPTALHRSIFHHKA